MFCFFIHCISAASQMCSLTFSLLIQTDWSRFGLVNWIALRTVVKSRSIYIQMFVADILIYQCDSYCVHGDGNDYLWSGCNTIYTYCNIKRALVYNMLHCHFFILPFWLLTSPASRFRRHHYISVVLMVSTQLPRLPYVTTWFSDRGCSDRHCSSSILFYWTRMRTLLQRLVQR